MLVPRWVRELPWIGPSRRLAWYPPLHALSVQVVALSDDWRHARIRLPLNRVNRNPGGGMFGGSIAALADPIPALACNRVFPGHQLWTRSMSLDFRREGRSDLELRFDFDPDQESRIRVELDQRGRANPTFEYGLYDDQECLCVVVKNQVAIRPAGYRPEQRNRQR